MIGVLIFPDFQLLDAAGPISVFDIAMRLAGANTATVRRYARVATSGTFTSCSFALVFVPYLTGGHP